MVALTGRLFGSSNAGRPADSEFPILRDFENSRASSCFPHRIATLSRQSFAPDGGGPRVIQTIDFGCSRSGVGDQRPLRGRLGTTVRTVRDPRSPYASCLCGLPGIFRTATET